MLERAKSAAIAGLPAWVTNEEIAETRAVYEPLYGCPLSNDDITEILVNTDQMFRLFYNGADKDKPANSDDTVSDCRPVRASPARRTSGWEVK